MQKQQLDPSAAARWIAERLKKDQREVPQGQLKGPIRLGSVRTVVECKPCTRMFGYTRKDGSPAIIGVLKRLVKRHAADHKLGRIKAVTS